MFHALGHACLSFVGLHMWEWAGLKSKSVQELAVDSWKLSLCALNVLSKEIIDRTTQMKSKCSITAEMAKTIPQPLCTPIIHDCELFPPFLIMLLVSNYYIKEAKYL